MRNPQTVTEYIRVQDGRNKDGSIDWDVVEVVVSQSISVSLDCTADAACTRWSSHGELTRQ